MDGILSKKKKNKTDYLTLKILKRAHATGGLAYSIQYFQWMESALRT